METFHQNLGSLSSLPIMHRAASLGHVAEPDQFRAPNPHLSSTPPPPPLRLEITPVAWIFFTRMTRQEKTFESDGPALTLFPFVPLRSEEFTRRLGSREESERDIVTRSAEKRGW